MPYGNRMGPGGAGPRSGRAAGYCAGYGVPGYTNPAQGGGFGTGGWVGHGGGHGWRHWYYATGQPGWMRGGRGGPGCWSWHEPFFSSPTREQEVEELKAQSEYFKDGLKAIEKRIEEIQASRGEEE
jgi:hypothetical protein